VRKKVDKWESAGRRCAVEIEFLPTKSYLVRLSRLRLVGEKVSPTTRPKPLTYPKADLTTPIAANSKSKSRFVVYEPVIVTLEVFRIF
jgi:hypothetical protein